MTLRALRSDTEGRWGRGGGGREKAEAEGGQSLGGLIQLQILSVLIVSTK